MLHTTRVTHIFSLLIVFFLSLSGCGGGGGGGSNSHPGTLIGIDVRTSFDELRYVGSGATLQFVALGNYSDGDTGVSLTGVNWTSDTPQVATVDSNGLITGVTLGNATITANIGDISGTNTLGVTSPATGWSAVSVGQNHVLAVKADGSLWSWYNTAAVTATSLGQLGIGNVAFVYAPVRVGTDTNWDKVSAGYQRSFALKKDGTLWAWGQNTNGELGDGGFTNRYVPTQIGTSSNWASISTKWDHTLALQKDGTLWGWGKNIWAQLGDNSSTDRTVPTQIGTATNWISASAGNTHSMGIQNDGSLWAWGTSEHGELGNGVTPGYFNRYYVPTLIGSDTNWSKVASGFWQTLAVKTDGSLYGWGYHYTSDSVSGSPSVISPTRMGTEANWSDVTQGYRYGIVSKNDGSLWSTRSEYGYVGPVQQLGDATGWASVAVGDYFREVAINSSGILNAWNSSSPPEPIVDLPSNGTGAGPSPSVFVPPPPPPPGAGGGGNLIGTWANSSGSWTFNSSGVAVIDQISTNYGTDAHQITTLNYTSTGSLITYTITRAQLTCVCQYSYDETVSSGPYTEGYSISGNALTIGGLTYYQ